MISGTMRRKAAPAIRVNASSGAYLFAGLSGSADASAFRHGNCRGGLRVFRLKPCLHGAVRGKRTPPSAAYALPVIVRILAQHERHSGELLRIGHARRRNQRRRVR